jgi:hypothetical protein
MADRAALPLRIKDGGVAIPGKYHCLLVGEHTGRSFDERAQTVLRVTRIETAIEDKEFFWLLGRIPNRVPG